MAELGQREQRSIMRSVLYGDEAPCTPYQFICGVPCGLRPDRMNSSEVTFSIIANSPD